MKYTSAIAKAIIILLLGTICVSCEKSMFSILMRPTALPIINPDNLNFKDTETKLHFESLNRCINNFIDVRWKAIPYHLYGNFCQASWCQGSGAKSDCRIAESTIDNRDQHVLSLNTLTYPQEFPAVFGLGFEALRVPPGTGWGVHFSFSENGGSVVGDHWGVRFDKYNTLTDQSESTVILWSYDEYKIQDTRVQYSFNLPLRDDLALYLKSPEAMRTRRLEQIRALAQKVKTTIETHQAKTCDLGPYQNDGIPPECTPRLLTPEEETEELVKAEKIFSDQEQILNENYQELYAAWMNAFPMDQFWP
jgi:hypothetical protein